MITIPIETSARHIHLSARDVGILFGEGYQLTPIKKLSQPGQYACAELVEIQSKESWGLAPHLDFTFGKSCDHNQLRVLGPARDKTQVELSWSDFLSLGLSPQVALSGETTAPSEKIILIGPYGELPLTSGIIIAKRHIHCSLAKAKAYELADRQIVSVKVIDDGSGEKLLSRRVTFHEIVVRVSENFDWQLHLDVDEANAAGIRGLGIGEVIK